MPRRTAAEAKAERRADRVVASNRRAFHDYFITEQIEAGVVLTGTEIKSIRDGKITISEAYARIVEDELWLYGAHITPYMQGSYTNPDPLRRRKLLVHKKQIRDLREMVEQKGMTLVPLRVRLAGGKAKVEVGAAKGKQLHDKRQATANRDANRDIQRALRDRG